MSQTLAQLLSQNSYPGRGIMLGRSADGQRAVIAYFIMGRSENSRNRIFIEDGEGIRTQAHDPSKLTDSSLIIYAPVRIYHGKNVVTIVTNGDQTDTIYDGFGNGYSFAQTLCARTFEPDAPNFTPRISGVLRGFDYALSILKSADGNPDAVRRFFFEFEAPLPGQGHFIHTYRGDGNPLPSFSGEPTLVAVGDDLDAMTRDIWDGLNQDNRVSLFVRTIEVATGKTETRIVNRHH